MLTTLYPLPNDNWNWLRPGPTEECLADETEDQIVARAFASVCLQIYVALHNQVAEQINSQVLGQLLGDALFF